MNTLDIERTHFPNEMQCYAILIHQFSLTNKEDLKSQLIESGVDSKHAHFVLDNFSFTKKGTRTRSVPFANKKDFDSWVYTLTIN